MDETPLLTEEEITGFPTQEEKDKNDNDYHQEMLRRESFIKQTVESQGWKIILDFLNQEIFSWLNQLKIEQDINKIRRIQAMVSTLEFLPRLIDLVSLEAEKAREFLITYTESGKPPQG